MEFKEFSSKDNAFIQDNMKWTPRYSAATAEPALNAATNRVASAFARKYGFGLFNPFLVAPKLADKYYIPDAIIPAVRPWKPAADALFLHQDAVSTTGFVRTNGFGSDGLVTQLQTGELFPDLFMGWSVKTILVAALILTIWKR